MGRKVSASRPSSWRTCRSSSRSTPLQSVDASDKSKTVKFCNLSDDVLGDSRRPPAAANEQPISVSSVGTRSSTPAVSSACLGVFIFPY